MASTTIIDDLGMLSTGPWHQYSNAAGQVYFVNVVTGTSQFAIPEGWEDTPTDTWALDTTKTWPQWNNSRTGRAVLFDPNPPPPRTYLDDRAIRAHINVLQSVPESLEHMYRRPMAVILQLLFPLSEGYSVVRETNTETTRPDFTTFKFLRRPGGTLHSYEFLMVESKGNRKLFENVEPQCNDHLANCNNESKNAYGIIQCALEVQFYKHENFRFQSISPTLHLVDDAAQIMDMFRHLKDHPMSFV